MWILAFSYASFRWKRSRSIIESFPVVVIEDCRLLDEMLRLERLTAEEVLDAAREQGIRDLKDVGSASWRRTGSSRSSAANGMPNRIAASRPRTSRTGWPA
jgi:uncharacterized membrane protein YcaP (DUF421 family)